MRVSIKDISIVLLALGGLFSLSAAAAAQDAGHHGHDHGHEATAGDSSQWRMPPMDMIMMMPGIQGRIPNVGPYLPGQGIDPATIPAARLREVMELADGDTIDLEAMLVRRVFKDDEFVMFGFNGQYPGPLIRVEQHSTITVNFTNSIDMPSTIHWHGIRLANEFDGVPGVTQDAVQPGESFVYEVVFPDAGIYWYHPHVREDIQQDLGLYGNMLVDSPDPDYYGPANREEILILDDLLVDERGLFPWGAEHTTHATMGRFGNLFLVNGKPGYSLEVTAGEVVRFHLTNVANARALNVSFGGNPIKLVAGDLSRFEREEWVESVVLAPAERYVVDVHFEKPGDFAFMNRAQGLDHMMAEFVEAYDTLGVVTVRDGALEHDHRVTFAELRAYQEVTDDIEGYREHFDRLPDHEMVLTIRAGDLPAPVLLMMGVDTIYAPPVEWTDGMVDMNWLVTGRDITWLLREPATGRENLDLAWEFEQGDVIKLRIVNDPLSLHPMHHPIHIHGQRFLVLDQDGRRKENLVWQDTALIPVGTTVDLLVEMSNPGDWMIHCHTAEHLSAGMAMVFTVHASP